MLLPRARWGRPSASAEANVATPPSLDETFYFSTNHDRTSLRPVLPSLLPEPGRIW